MLAHLAVALLSLPTITHNNLFGNNNEIHVNGVAVDGAVASPPSAASPPAASPLVGACSVSSEPNDDMFYPSTALTAPAWGVYEYSPLAASDAAVEILGSELDHTQLEGGYVPGNEMVVTETGSRKKYMPGAEGCGYYKWALAKFAHYYGLPDPTTINTTTTSYAKELKEFEKTATDIQKSVALVVKVFSMVLKIEEIVGKYGATMNGHGTLYFSRLLFEPSMVVKDVSTSSELSLWDEFSIALPLVWTDELANNTASGSVRPESSFIFNFMYHTAGAFSVLPNTGFTAEAIRIMGENNHALAGFPTEPYMNTRLVPKHFPTCISAIHVHDYLNTVESGDTTMLCSIRGAAAMNALVKILDYEKEIEDGSSCYMPVADMTQIQKDAYDAMRRSRLDYAVGKVWTGGTPVMTAKQWNRYTELWMRPIDVHLSNINTLCSGQVTYVALYPNPFPTDGSPANWGRDGKGKEGLPIADMAAARKDGQCAAGWLDEDDCAGVHPEGQAGCSSIDSAYCDAM